MVPLLTLGIPGSGATAVILGAFLLHGVQPGPQIFQTQSMLVYAIFASVFLGVIGMGLLGLKFLLFLGLVSALFFRVNLDGVSFIVGVSSLLVASVIGTLSSGPSLSST